MNETNTGWTIRKSGIHPSIHYEIIWRHIVRTQKTCCSDFFYPGQRDGAARNKNPRAHVEGGGSGGSGEIASRSAPKDRTLEGTWRVGGASLTLLGGTGVGANGSGAGSAEMMTWSRFNHGCRVVKPRRPSALGSAFSAKP